MKIAVVCANGKAGGLYVNPEHTIQVCDGPDFPPDSLTIKYK